MRILSDNWIFHCLWSCIVSPQSRVIYLVFYIVFIYKCLIPGVSSSELLYFLQLLEGDGVGAAGFRQDFSVCHNQLHWRTFHGSRQRPAGRLTRCFLFVRSHGAWTHDTGGDDFPKMRHQRDHDLTSQMPKTHLSPVCIYVMKLVAQAAKKQTDTCVIPSLSFCALWTEGWYPASPDRKPWRGCRFSFWTVGNCMKKNVMEQILR